MELDDIDKLKEYKAELLKVLEKSQESFEKQLSYISAGGLGLSMIFIEKVVKNVSHSECKWLLASSWIFLGITLIGNLISHLISARSTYRTLDDIQQNQFDYFQVRERTNFINRFNTVSVITLLVGILLLILFVTINLYL